MKSFSSFKPTHTGTPQEMKAHTFAMWLRANAVAIQKPFDPVTWRTARPWLSFEDIQYQKKLFKNRSLGLLLVGNVTLTDQNVFTAVDYEALATNKISDTEIRKMILEFYDFSRIHTLERREVLDKINEEFAFLGRGYVSERGATWKAALDQFTERAKCTLKPKIHEHRVARIILQMFSPSEEQVSKRDLHHAISPVLLKLNQPISVDSPILRRALSVTGLHLKHNNHATVIENIVAKLYIKHPLANEPLERLTHIVQQFANIPQDYDVWSLVNLNIAPKHDWVDSNYEEAIDEKYHNPPKTNKLQEPFLKYKLPFKYIRKKQDIPWKKIMKQCTRGRGTTATTIEHINKLFVDLGIVPYHPTHRVFDIIRVQGLVMK